MITVREALYRGASLLEKSETPFLDASIILSHILDISKEKLFASYPDPVDPGLMERYLEAMEKRKKNVPVAYITNKKEFFGLTFYVDERVLSPRPDTETLVETALEIVGKNPKVKKILDMCTGSGCIGISLKSSLPELAITCSDISPDAVDVCRYNSNRLLSKPVVIQISDLFEKITGEFDMIVSNPPYVPAAEVKAIRESSPAEPQLALDGGDDGLDLIREIIPASLEHLTPRGYLLLESSIEQTYSIERMMKKAGYTDIETRMDLTGRNRVTVGRKPLA